MIDLSKTATAALSAAVLGLAVAACQPQGEPAATDETAAAEEMPTAETAAADAMSSDEMGGAEFSALVAGNTILGVLDSWKLRWSEYFAPNGTARAVLRFEGQDDMEITGSYYTNARDEFCTEYPELPDQTVFCSMIVPLGDGRYQQVYADGTRGSIYTQILEGEQLDALE